MLILRPGERNILRTLQEGPKKFTYLNLEKPKLNTRILSKYLKNLQKEGLIERDIGTREYFIKKTSYASLLFNDIIEFIENYLKQTSNKELEESGSIYERTTLRRESLTFGWFMLTDNPKLQELYSKEFEEPKKQKILLEFSNSLGSIWDSYKLSEYTKHSIKTREIIKTYEKYLLAVHKKIEKPQNEEQKKFFNETAREIALFQLKQKYPDISDSSIPEEMINFDMRKIVQDFEKAHDLKMAAYNFDDLKRSIEIIEKEDIREFTEQDSQELEEMLDFLENKKNRKIYEGFIAAREKDRPKSLILCPFGGFKGYLDKLESYFQNYTKTGS